MGEVRTLVLFIHMVLQRPKRHLVAIVVKPTDLPTQDMKCLSTTYCIPPLHTAQAAEHMNPTAVSLQLFSHSQHHNNSQSILMHALLQMHRILIAGV